MNVVVALKDYTELDRLVRPLVAAGCQVTPVNKYRTLLRTLSALRADAVIVDLGFGEGGDEQLLRTVRGTDGPRVLVLVPDRWPSEASHVFEWGADDLVRRPLCAPEILARLQRMTGGTTRVGSGPLLRGAPDEWERFAFWRDLEAIVTAELGATIGAPLVRAAGDGTRPLHVVGLSRLLLPVEGLELIIAVGVDADGDGPLAAALMGAPPSPEIIDDVVTELTNVAAGSVKRAALSEGKVFAMGLPRLHRDLEVALPLARRWKLQGGHGIRLHCVAAARSSRPEVVACASLREGMVVNSDVVAPGGMLLAAQGTFLTERAVERLRSMLGDRFAVEVTLPAFTV